MIGIKDYRDFLNDEYGYTYEKLDLMNDEDCKEEYEFLINKNK